MSLVPQIEQTALTPNRQTSITWDIEEGVVTEEVFFLKRAGNQLFPSASAAVERLASGIWVLAPLTSFPTLHEQSASHAFTLRLSQFTAASIVKEITLYRPLTELSGIGVAAAANTAGDHWFTKRVGAGATWSTAISAGPQPTLPTANYPLDRVMRSTITPDAMTGYILRVKLPGAAFQTPDTLIGFQFGGEIHGSSATPHTGFGLFEVVLRGDGRALLFEWIDAAWTQVASWQFQTPKESAENVLMLRVLPHFPRYLEFLTTTAGIDPLFTQSARLGAAALLDRGPENTAVGAYVHEVTNRGEQAFGAEIGTLHPITGPGRICIDVRRDLRANWSISRLAYPATGTLTDRPFVVPYNPTVEHVLRVSVLGYNFFAGTFQATSMSAVLQTAAGVALSAGAESFTLRGTAQ